MANLDTTGLAGAGLASTPPLGWRSWNLYGRNVNQELMESIMDGVVNRRHAVVDHGDDDSSSSADVMMSLCDLGYCDVGLDDNWQACNATNAAPGMNYHDSLGAPIVNTERFPDMKAMTDHAHSLGLKAGWYHNNCICPDRCRDEKECDMQTRGDAQAIIDFNFDSVKLDGCGGETNLTLFQKYLNEDDDHKDVMIENCHWGVEGYVPTKEEPDCAYSFYRTSGDIRPNYQSVMFNLQSVDVFHKQNLSRPGCWAYPDMLQVGVRQDWTGSEGLNEAETRSHFGAWAIVSSPLILSHDVNNDTITKEIWHLIANREVLAVNQAYVGDSGGVFQASDKTIQLPDIKGWQAFPGDHKAPATIVLMVPSYQFLSKQLDGGKVAVLLMNSANKTSKLRLSFDKVPGVDCKFKCSVRDIWEHKTIGMYSSEWSVSVEPHDAAFVVLEPVTFSNTTKSITSSTVSMVIIIATFMAIVVFTVLLCRDGKPRRTRKRNTTDSAHNSPDDVEYDELKVPPQII